MQNYNKIGDYHKRCRAVQLKVAVTVGRSTKDMIVTTHIHRNTARRSNRRENRRLTEYFTDPLVAFVRFHNKHYLMSCAFGCWHSRRPIYTASAHLSIGSARLLNVVATAVCDIINSCDFH